MSVFPLDITNKEDTPERLLALANVPEKNKILATDFMIVVDALKELKALTPYYLADNNGLVWRIQKGQNNVDLAAFQNGDKIEAFIDQNKKHWVEGELVDNGFTGIGDLDNEAIFFDTNSKIVRS